MKIKNTFLALCLITSVGVSLSPQDVLSIKPKMFINDKKGLITPPASYNFSYIWSAITNRYVYYDNINDIEFNVDYSRTSDGAYYDYFSGIGSAVGQGFKDASFNPIGLDISLQFHRSDSTWGTTGGGSRYVPTDTKIGSSNEVGTTTSKVDLNFNNQTSKDYFLFLDISPSSSDHQWLLKIDNGSYVYVVADYSQYVFKSNMVGILIPSYSNVQFLCPSVSTAEYLGAFYIKDMGVSNSYQEGYDNASGIGQNSYDILSSNALLSYSYAYDSGYIDGGSVMTDIFSLFSSAIAVVGDVLSISLFGAFTIGGLISIPLVMGLLFWIIEKWRGR
jgi:hypothetical protein